MGKKAIIIAGTVAATLLLSACQTASILRTAPILNVESQQIAASGSSYSLEDVRKAIVRAGSRRGWIFSDAGEGKLVGTLTVRKHKATVDVNYSKKAYDITYRESQNLSYNEAKGVIHSNYNGWISNLVKDITLELSLL